jgi:NADPH:quinone reductase-like Zn-dependent oxidoreductase
MKAALYDRYGGADEVYLGEAPEPTAGRGELLVQVHAAALNPKDVLVRMGKLRLWSGARFPRQVGWDWAGAVLSVGPGVTQTKEGDAVYGMIQSIRAGACAERARVRVSECAPMPKDMSFVEAAAVPLAAQTALQALRDSAGVGPGARVLINGASGGVGSFAVQIAKILGAHVTTTSSELNLALCSELGADVALDYAKTDALSARGSFDAVFDVFGNRRFAQARAALRPKGTFVSTVIRGHVFAAVLESALRAQRAKLVVVRSRREDLLTLAKWIEDGRLRPVIDQTFDFGQMAEAMARVGSKHARGKVVVCISPRDTGTTNL